LQTSKQRLGEEHISAMNSLSAEMNLYANAMECEGINLYALTRKEKIIIGCSVGLGLNLAILADALSNLNLFPNRISIAPM